MRAPERAALSLLLLAICGLCCLRPAVAQPPAAQPPAEPLPLCTGDMLDFHLVHNPFSASSAPGHLLAIVIHNRGLTPCILPPAKLELIPTPGAPVSQSAPVDYPAPLKLSNDRWPLEPGQSAHFVLAWSSAPPNETSRGPDCATQESLVFNPEGQGPSRWLTVHHLYIRPCGYIWASPYGQGTDTTSEPFPQQWLDRFQLQPTAVVPSNT